MTGTDYGWELFPLPPIFWRRVTVQAIYPEVAYKGPLPQRDADVLAIQRMSPAMAYVYLISDAESACLYVGKTVNPTGRFSKHRRREWWPKSGSLILLGVHGTDRRDSEALALKLEKLAIRDSYPQHNIVGAVAP